MHIWQQISELGLQLRVVQIKLPTLFGKLRDVEDDKKSLGLRHPRLRTLDANLLDLVRTLTDACRVAETNLVVANGDTCLHNIARRAWNRGHYRDILLRQVVHQCTFAGVRWPDDDDLESLTDNLGTLCAIEDSLDFFFE